MTALTAWPSAADLGARPLEAPLFGAWAKEAPAAIRAASRQFVRGAERLMWVEISWGLFRNALRFGLSGLACLLGSALNSECFLVKLCRPFRVVGSLREPGEVNQSPGFRLPVG